MSVSPFHLLVVEDNPADAKLLQIVLKNKGFAGTLDVIQDGAKAVEYLFQKGEFSSALRPDAIILDLNLPKLSGIEILETVAPFSTLSTIPTYILSTSIADYEKTKCEQLHIRTFFTKPRDLLEFEKIVEHLMKVEFPTARRGR